MRVKQYVSKLNYQLSIVERRKEIGQHLLQDSLAEGHLQPLSDAQRKAVERVWGSRKKLFDWRWFELYNWEYPEIGEDIWKFIPVDYWLAYIDPLYAQPVGGLIFDDKNMYDLYFPDVKQPKTVVRYIDGTYQSPKYDIIEEGAAIELCQNAGQVVIKPAIGTCGGKGIVFWNKETDSIEALQQVFAKNRCYIVQEVVRQHPVMASLNESSCNTIRMLSFLHKGEVVVFPSSYTRFGGKGSCVDNVSSGGFCAGINPDGQVNSMARNHNEKRVKISTDGTPIIIPNYHKCQSIAKHVAPRLSHITKLVAWDFAIGEDAEPILIEVNVERTSIQSFQALVGPILGDYVETFLKDAPVYDGSKNPFFRGLIKLLRS